MEQQSIPYLYSETYVHMGMIACSMIVTILAIRYLTQHVED